MIFKKGDRVRYTSFAGDVYTATITGIHPPDHGHLDAAIDVPGLQEPVEFHYLPARRFELVQAPEAERVL